MSINAFRHALEHSPLLNYALGCLTTAATIWFIDRILKAK